MSIGIIRNVTRDTFENPDTLNSKNADSPHLRPAFCFFSCQSYAKEGLEDFILSKPE